MIMLLIYIIFVFFINFLINKYQLILSNSGLSHQSFVNNSIPLTGGIFSLLPVIYLFLPNYSFFLVVFISLFILGILSDLNILVSPKKRFLLQFLLILIFSLTNQLDVTPTKIFFVDSIIQNNYLGYIFTTFCLMILINGSNFIDGLNGLLLGYFSLIILLIFKLDILESLNFSQEKYTYFILVILFLLLLNFFNKLFLGDSGAYSLSFLIGFILIKIYNFNQNISPYFIVLLLWYPCFENLFSIIRKIFYKKQNPLEPDTEHFHQKLFTYCKTNLKINSFKSNILSSLIILLFNFFIFYFASKAISHTIYQLSLLGVSIITYLITYFIIHKLIKKNNTINS
jgi:UDP-N-acetylmuramyl pentapeptide phosphotransferase/UDP-N-acetylglucosamine-1-phosphate transferase